MTIRHGLVLALALGLIGLAATSVYSEGHAEEKKPAASEKLTPAGIMDMMVGDWDAAGQFWQPGAEQPMPFPGKAKMSKVFQNYLQQDFEGVGMPFKGRSIMAYDKGRKKWQSTWIDSMSHHITITEPTFEGKTRTFSSTFDSYSPDGTVVKMRDTLVLDSKDKFTMEHFAVGGGADGKDKLVMRIIYTRKK